MIYPGEWASVLKYRLEVMEIDGVDFMTWFVVLFRSLLDATYQRSTEKANELMLKQTQGYLIYHQYLNAAHHA